MHIIFQFLENVHLSWDEFIPAIVKWDESDLLHFAEEYRKVNFSYELKNDSMFNFIANSQQSGGLFPCSLLECRFAEVDRLGRFAALYSDVVIIRNPLDQFSFPLFALGSDENFDFATLLLIECLRLLYYLKPLLDCSIVELGPGENMWYCQHCYGKLKDDFKPYIKGLKELIYEKTAYRVKKKNGMFRVFQSCSEDIFAHNEMELIMEPSEFLKKAMKGKREIPLDRKQIEKLGYVDQFLQDLMFDLYKQSCNVKVYKGQFLWAKQFNIDFANQIRRKFGSDLTRSDLLIEGLTHTVPHIQGCSFENLIEFRNKNFEAFLSYRDELRTLIKGGHFNSSNEVLDAINDIIKPQLHKINQSIAASKKILLKDVKSDLAISSALVAFGVFNGFLPNDLSHIFTAVGGYQFLSGLIKKANQAAQPNLEAMSNSYYYLYQLQAHI